MKDHIWKKAILYTATFQCTHMSHCEARVLYRSCFLPTLTYPLPATWLPDTFLERVMELSMSTILKKWDYIVSKLPQARHLGGFGLSNLTHKQGAQKILILLCHLLHAKIPLSTAMETLI